MTAGLFAALVKAQGLAQAVAKDGTNKFHNYDYATSESMIAEARGALNEAGLAVMPMGWELAPQPNGYAFVRVYYKLAHTSGESIDLRPCDTYVVPDKGRPDDKAEAAALTYNLAYFLRGLLLLPRVDEEELDRRDDRKAPPRGGQTQQRPPVQQAAPKPLAGQLQDSISNEQLKLCAEIESRLRKAATPSDREKIGGEAKLAFNGGKISQEQLSQLARISRELNNGGSHAAHS